MKKRIFSILVTAIMVMMLLPSVVAAEDTAVNVDSFAELKTALESGATVITTDEILVINEDYELDLTGVTITGSAKKVFEIGVNYGESCTVTITGGTIINTYNNYNGSCINTRTNVDLTLDGVTLQTPNGINAQPLTIGGYTNGAVVRVVDSTIEAGASSYGIIVFVQSDITIDNSNVTGYAALYCKDGSEGTIVNVTNESTLSSVNNIDDTTSNNFATVVFENDNVTINVVNSTVTAAASSSASQSIFGGTADVNEITINVDADSTLTATGDNAGYLAVTENAAAASTIAVPTEYVEGFAEAGVTFEASNETNGVSYSSVESAIEAAEENDTITLLDLDDDVTEIAVDKSLKINLGNNTGVEIEVEDDAVVTIVNEDGDTESVVCDHIYLEAWHRDGDHMVRHCDKCGEPDTMPLTTTEIVKDRIRATMKFLMTTKYNVVAKTSEGGSTSINGKATYNYNKDVKITITPDEGYEVESVILNGEDLGAKTSVVIKNIKADYKLEVTFKAVESAAIAE